MRAEMLSVSRGAYAEVGTVLQDYVAWRTDPAVFSRYQRVMLYRAGDRPVAYLHGFAQIVDLDGQPVEIIRASIATLPAYRGHGLIGSAYLRVVADYTRRFGLSRLPRYCSTLFLSPLIYGMAGRRARQMYPSPDPVTDPSLARMYALLHGDGALVPGLAPPFEPEEVHAGLRESDDPYVRFYLKANPRFTDGYALPVLVRVNSGDIAYALAMSAKSALGRRLRSSRR